jgi:hypothetical protein
MTIQTERLSILDTLTLGEGSHDDGRGYCLMEAVAYVAGEPHTDQPEEVDADGAPPRGHGGRRA